MNRCLLLLVSILSLPAMAQYDADYQPTPYSNKKSKELIQYADQRYDIQQARLKNQGVRIPSQYAAITQSLKSVIQDEGIITDSAMNAFVESIYHKLLEQNQLTCTPGKVLIVRSAEINALCLGEGTLLLTLGLLSHMKTVEELAFVLAHELAHYEKDHVYMKIDEYQRNRVRHVETSTIKKMQHGKLTVKDLNYLNEVGNNVGRYSRQMELQADSLGLEMVRRAGLDTWGGVTALQQLGELERLPLEEAQYLFDPLHTPKYPFQPEWLNPRWSIYQREQVNPLFAQPDSVRSHPDMDMRLEKIKSISRSQDEQTPLPAAVRLVAMFEAVHSAQLDKQYDRGLYYALQLKHIFPANRYLTTAIATLLTDVVASHKDGTFDQAVTKNSSAFGNTLRQINDMLHNCTAEELGHMAFYFMNFQPNFDSQYDEHYWLLYRICDITGRDEVKQKVKARYKELFPKGKHLSAMK